MSASDPVAGLEQALRVTGAPASSAEARPVEPPPDLASQGLRADGGKGLAATRALAKGDAVVDASRPLLLAPALKPSHPASKLLREFSEQDGSGHIPPSVVLKLAAYLCAPATTAEWLAALRCPSEEEDASNGGGAADAEARACARSLRERPPPVLPPGTIEGWPTQGAEADDDDAERLEARWRALWADEARTRRAWLLWSAGGRPGPAPTGGSALAAGPWALAHACRGANTVYVPSPQGGWGGRHVALRAIAAGEALTTCYLGTGRGALLLTSPERRARLASAHSHGGGEEEEGGGNNGACCECSGCRSAAVDAARGVPCPECSSHFRAEDRLLTAEAAGKATAEGEGGRRRLGYIYRSGGGNGGDGPAEWKCDHCAQSFPDDTAEVWGRHYARSHATIEGQMSALASRVDASLDQRGPLSSDVGELAKRVDGVARLLGPRHAAVWRLRLAQAECHAGEAERLLAGLGPEPQGGRTATALEEVKRALDCLDRIWDAVLAAPFEKEGMVLLHHAASGEEEEEKEHSSAAAERARAAVAAEALAHHAIELCSLAREACTLAAASPSEADATAEARRELSKRAETWLARVEGHVEAMRRVSGRAAREGGDAPSAAAAECSNAQVREIVGKLQRMAAEEGVS